MMTSRQAMVKKAKRHLNPDKRKWLRVGRVDPYGSELNRVEFWVLEGSPARGFIIASNDWAARLDGHGELLKTFFELEDVF